MMKKIINWILSFFVQKTAEAENLKKVIEKRNESDKEANKTRNDIKRNGLSNFVRHNDI